MRHNSSNLTTNPLDQAEDIDLLDVTNRLSNMKPNPKLTRTSFNYFDDFSDEMSQTSNRSKLDLFLNNFTILFCKIFYNFATFLIYILSITGLAAIYISCLISFFCFIIVVFIFFLSFITAYIMSPIYLSLSGSWIKFIFTIFKVILSSPLVAFFLYFLANAIRKLGDLIERLPEFLAQRKLLIRNLKGEIQDVSSYVKKYEHPMLKIVYVCFLNLLKQLLITCIGLALFFLTFVYDFPLLLGTLIFIPTFVQIIILLLPTYLDFFKLLTGEQYKNKKGQIIMETKEMTGISAKLRHWIEKTLIKNLKKIDDDDDGIVKLNQETQTFVTEQGDFSSKIGYSQNYYSHEQIKALDSVPSKEDKVRKLKEDFLRHVLQVAYANEFIPLYSYGRMILMDQYRKNMKIILFWVFFLLNIGLIIFDIYRLIETYQTYFLFSTVIRLLIIPLLSFFHPLIQFFSVAKDKLLRVIINIASVVTFIIGIIIVACIAFNNMYKRDTRIKTLDYVPINKSVAYLNEKMLGHQVCQYNLYDISSVDAFGYALGSYDVIDNPIVFENQMKTFFGENYTSHISYKVEKMSPEIPFIIFHDSAINTTIVAFRGFNSGTEIAIMIEMIANEYLIPFFEDLVPLMETLSDFGLGEQSKIAHKLGKLMLEPKNLFETYIDTILDICINNEIDQQDRVLFTGINTGGTFAKIAGIQLKKYSLSFLTLPISGDFSVDTFGIEEADMSYVTNIFINKAVFAISEPDVATNIGVFAIDYKNPPKWCKSDICHFNMKKESVYPALCEIAGLCGKNSQFDHYCKTVIGEDNVNTIRDFVMSL